MKTSKIRFFFLEILTAGSLIVTTSCGSYLENNPAYTRAALEKEAKRSPSNPKVNPTYTYKYPSH